MKSLDVHELQWVDARLSWALSCTVYLDPGYKSQSSSLSSGGCICIVCDRVCGMMTDSSLHQYVVLIYIKFKHLADAFLDNSAFDSIFCVIRYSFIVTREGDVCKPGYVWCTPLESSFGISRCQWGGKAFSSPPGNTQATPLTVPHVLLMGEEVSL